MNRICPQCMKAFDGQDYCTEHGLALVIPENEALPEQRLQIPNALDSASDNRASRLADCMARIGQRPFDQGDSPSAPGDSPPSPGLAPAVVPTTLMQQGWRVVGLPIEVGGMTAWQVDRDGVDGRREHAAFHRFKMAPLTSVEVLQRLAARTSPCMVRLLDHGTVDVLDSRAGFELVAQPPDGSVGLGQWFHETQPSEERAVDLLKSITSMLTRLAEEGVRPLVLEPNHLVRTPDGEVWLMTVAALDAMDAPPSVHPEFERSPLLPRGWTAPEMLDACSSRQNSVMFSLGQLVAYGLWGQACTIAELQRGSVNFRRIADASLARVLMGCLWPRPEERWTLADVSRALEADGTRGVPDAPPWGSLSPGASSTAFIFGGASYWRLEDLLQATCHERHWREATERIEDILTWAMDTVYASRARSLSQALTHGRSKDWVLIRFLREATPETLLTWRGLDLSDEQAQSSLIGLANRALQEGGQAEAIALHDLFMSDLRGAFRLDRDKT